MADSLLDVLPIGGLGCPWRGQRKARAAPETDALPRPSQPADGYGRSLTNYQLVNPRPGQSHQAAHRETPGLRAGTGLDSEPPSKGYWSSADHPGRAQRTEHTALWLLQAPADTRPLQWRGLPQGSQPGRQEPQAVKPADQGTQFPPGQGSNRLVPWISLSCPVPDHSQVAAPLGRCPAQHLPHSGLPGWGCTPWSSGPWMGRQTAVSILGKPGPVVSYTPSEGNCPLTMLSAWAASFSPT